MFVELNDKAFYKANEGDIFSIQIIHNKKFAAPISKQELLDAELKRISLLEQEVDRLKQEKQKLQEENEEFKKNVNEKINRFISVFKNESVGGNDEESL